MTASASTAPGLRARLGEWVESPTVQWFVIAVILVNAATLGAETSSAMRANHGGWLRALDVVALSIFVVELALKLFAFGPRFFRSGWNVFDLVVVGIALVPSSGPLAVLRALRVLRVLRLVSAVPQLRFVVEALLKAIPGIAAIGGLMLIIFYVGAVIVVGLFGEAYPHWFGGLDKALYTLFQIMTMDSWSSGITRPIMEDYPLAWLFFIPFVLIATFTMLNLFVAVIVNAMDTMRRADDVKAHRGGTLNGDHPDLSAELQALRRELAELNRRLADSDPTGR